MRNVEFRFAPGDRVWVIYQNKPQEMSVQGVGIKILRTGTKREYLLTKENGVPAGAFPEERVYGNIEEMKQDIFK